MRLLKGHQDKDDLIGKLKEEIDLLNRVSPALPTFFLPESTRFIQSGTNRMSSVSFLY